MPLIVENGTAVPNANSYVSVAEADAYFADRNDPNWAGEGALEATKMGLLLQAADYLNGMYRWKGEPIRYNHTMGLPTLATEAIPFAVKQAQMLLAREAKSGVLASPLGSQQVTSERKRLEGVGETETHYAEGSETGRTINSMVLGLISQYVVSPTGGIQTARLVYG